MAFVLYLSISLAIFIDILQAGVFFPTFSIIKLMEFISFACLISFGLVSIGNGFKVIKDNDWLLYIAVAITLVESLFFLSPFYFYHCGGSPVLNMILQIIIFVCSLIAMKISIRYKHRVGGK